MTEEQNTTDSAVATDAIVTQTYREIADEHTPGNLDRAILRRARRAARPRYLRSISWTRPMAWAATVMLSVALVLELTKIPTAEPVIFDDSAATFEVQQMESNSTATKQVAPEPVLEKRQRDSARQDIVEEQELATPATAIGEHKLKDTDMMHRAEEMARMQSGGNNQPAVAASSSIAVNADAEAPAAVGLSAAVTNCAESTTASPETWLECIAQLEDAGLADEALLQRKLLSKAFPEFDPH